MPSPKSPGLIDIFRHISWLIFKGSLYSEGILCQHLRIKDIVTVWRVLRNFENSQSNAPNVPKILFALVTSSTKCESYFCRLSMEYRCTLDTWGNHARKLRHTVPSVRYFGANFFVTLNACRHINHNSTKKHGLHERWHWKTVVSYKPPRQMSLPNKAVLEPIIWRTLINSSGSQISIPKRS